MTSEATAPQLSEQTKRTTLATFGVGALVGVRGGWTGATVGWSGAAVGATGTGVGGTGARVGANGAGVETTGAIVGDQLYFPFFPFFFLFLPDFPPFLLPFFRLLDISTSASTRAKMAIKTVTKTRNNILRIGLTWDIFV